MIVELRETKKQVKVLFYDRQLAKSFKQYSCV